MSARKSRFIGKILTGLISTIVAPVLATVVSQQVGDWEQTLKILVENETPAAKADWKEPTAEGGANAFQVGGRAKPSALLPALTAPREKAGDARLTPSCSR
jgi:hypothetical protein